MATVTMDRPSQIPYISSHELNILLEQDYHSPASWEEEMLRWTNWFENYKNEIHEIPRIDVEEELSYIKSEADLSCFNSPEHQPEDFSIIVNPRTGSLVTDPFKNAESSKTFLSLPVEPREPPKPYHWTQDHDYNKRIKEEDDDSDEQSSGLDIVNQIFKREDEPVVEVWKIENFNDKETAVAEPSCQMPGHSQTLKKETRRTSTRTAEIKRRDQARKISNAVHAVLKNTKPRRIRQSKSIKPKNSVETTPSQSDIEEWYSKPSKQTYTKVTKKKTSKGRIDHSESERHRREVLRTHFSILCNQIPQQYLRGEKVSSQVSKQKILNGAKAYIKAMHESKSSYKSSYHQNELLRERFQKKCSSKLLKCVRKYK